VIEASTLEVDVDAILSFMNPFNQSWLMPSVIIHVSYSDYFLLQYAPSLCVYFECFSRCSYVSVPKWPNWLGQIPPQLLHSILILTTMLLEHPTWSGHWSNWQFSALLVV